MDLTGDIIHEFRGHFGAVTSVKFTPDGKKFITGSTDKTSRLWDLSGKLLQLFSGQDADFSRVVISPRGKTMLSGNNMSTPFLWDLSGNLIHNFAEDKDILEEDFFSRWPIVSYSADGESIVIVDRNNGMVILQKIKMFLEDFQKMNLYETLSIAQRIEYGIIDYEDVIRLNSEKEWHEAAKYYHSKAKELNNRQELLEYLNNSINLYEKILETNKQVKYQRELLEVINYLRSIDLSGEILIKSINVLEDLQPLETRQNQE